MLVTAGDFAEHSQIMLSCAHAPQSAIIQVVFSGD